MIRRIVVLMVLFGCAVTPAPARAANAVVGTGTPASCTDAAFERAFLDAQQHSDGTISFNCGGNATIVLESPKYVQAGKKVTIDGQRQITLSGGGRSQLLGVTVGGTLNLLGLTLTNGYNDLDQDGRPIPGGGALTNGGTLYLQSTDILDGSTQDSGGAIQSTGVLTVEYGLIRGNSAAQYGGGLNVSGKADIFQTRIIDNRAGATAGRCSGGGISSDAVLTLGYTDVLTNSARTAGGGICNGGQLYTYLSNFRANRAESDGGAIYTYGNGRVDLQLTTFTRNKADGDGGAITIFRPGGQIGIFSSTFSENEARVGEGGAIYYEGNRFSADSCGSVLCGRLRIETSTLSKNKAGRFGGGISMFRAPDGYGPTLVNVTVSGNTAVDAGGGIYNMQGDLIVRETTLSGNAAPRGGAFVNTTAGSSQSATFEATNVLVGAGPAGVNCIFEGVTPTRQGLSLSSDATCAGFTQAPDLKLGVLQNNGGATATHMPLPGSPAIDRSDCVGASDKDQRGIKRPQDGDNNGNALCDVGAVERRLNDGVRIVFVPLAAN